MVSARAILICVVCAATWDHGDIQAGPLPRAMSGSVALLQLGSVMVSVTCFSTGGSLELCCDEPA